MQCIKYFVFGRKNINLLSKCIEYIVMKKINVHNPNNLPTIPFQKFEDLQGDLKTIDKNSLQKLKNSIKKYGIFVPKFVWKNDGYYYLIDGHQTKKALAELEKEGYEIPEIPYVEIKAKNKRDAAEKLLQINSRYGKINPDTEFFENFEIDESFLDEIEIPELDVEKLFSKEPVEINEDEIPEKVETRCKPGDLWLLERHRLLCGDATKREDVERLMDGEKADSLITDPPYGVDYSSKNEFLNRFDKGNCVQKPIKNDDVIEDYRCWFSKWLSNVKDFLNKYNTCYIFMSPQELHNLRLAFEDTNGHWSAYLVWVKNNHVLTQKDYDGKYEFIFYGWYGKHKFYGGFSTTVLEFDKPLKSELHPTMKPVSLLIKLISDGSPEGGIVLDLFGGSGSTLIACEQFNRICYMMEIDPHYCDVIIKRWENFTGEKAKLEGTFTGECKKKNR